MIERRHTNRRDFFDEDVPPDVIYELTTAAEQEETSLVQIVEPEHKVVAAQLSREAETIQNTDPRYQAELQAWTTTDLSRTDGVPVSAIPHTDSRFETGGLIRDFDVAGKGWLPRLRQSSLNHCLMVLGTAKSTRSAWLRAGEALQRILLEATRLDFVVSLASQVAEVPSTRDRLRKELGLRVSATSLDADRPSSSNARLQATGSDHDYFGDRRLTWPPSTPSPSKIGFDHCSVASRAGPDPSSWVLSPVQTVRCRRPRRATREPSSRSGPLGLTSQDKPIRVAQSIGSKVNPH